MPARGTESCEGVRTGFIEEDGDVAVGVVEEGEEHRDLGDGVVGTACAQRGSATCLRGA